MDLGQLGFGVTGHLDEDVVRWLAPTVEEAGFRTLWFNDVPGGDSLVRVKIAADLTERIRIGTGVIPLDRRPAADILAEVEALGLPVDRLLLGVGSGSTKGAAGVDLVKRELPALKAGYGGSVIVGALGPRMRQVGAQDADGILLNWLTPQTAREARDQMREDAKAAHAGDPMLVTYVRVGFGEAARPVLEAEAARYGAIPGYKANLARLGIQAIDAAVYGTTPWEVQEGIAAYVGTVDEVVIRAITPNESVDDYRALIGAFLAER
ncbi:MAG: LLM class flavin-dependent oxidoreductase [Thermomicrobiales bacterium]